MYLNLLDSCTGQRALQPRGTPPYWTGGSDLITIHMVGMCTPPMVSTRCLTPITGQSQKSLDRFVK